VGLVFAAVGRTAGALAPSVFAAVVVTVMATTFLAPPLLKMLRPKPVATAG
jgi:Kef-type K+ transport system membrane component KefB